MATGSLVSIQEYLSTTYRPDCDYVDGVVLERNLGEYDHSRLQSEVLFYFLVRRKQWGLRAVVEQRVQVSPSRFRVPDVCVVVGEPSGQIFRTPPFVCIEILSKDDRLSEMRERVDDYLKFGVPYVWIMDPTRRKAWRCTLQGMNEVSELRTEQPETIVPLGELFEAGELVE
ncbi:MAG TPA: Uma2 family endonuclease [Candidatus Acidoferrales bacterium]|jgi:Uma2 family endonuclease|nr:Uma2 family endonuclease [Candidatus Acidoferrales bacterium]